MAQEGITFGKMPTMDTPTRWNSTYLMIEKAMEYRRAFASLAVQDAKYVCVPTSIEWERAALLCRLLKVFYEATTIISGSSYSTSNLYFHEMWKIKSTLQKEASQVDPDIGKMVMGMQKKFNKYWLKSYKTLAIPVILDPRFKLKFIEFRLNQAFYSDAQLCIDEGSKLFRLLFDEYVAQLNNGSVNSKQGGQDDRPVVGAENDMLADWDLHLHTQIHGLVTR